MSLNKSIVEEAALEWFLLHRGFGGQVGEQCRVGRILTRPLPWREEAECEAIRRLNPGIFFHPFAILRDTLLPKLLSGELSG